MPLVVVILIVELLDVVEPHHALHAHALHAHEPGDLGLHVAPQAARPHGGQHLEGVSPAQGWGGVGLWRVGWGGE